MAEAAAWQLLRRKRLGVKVRRQVIVMGFIADFYVEALKLLIEIDGPMHTEANDKRRDAILKRHGFTTVRVKNETILQYPHLALCVIKEAINRTALLSYQKK